MAQLLSGNIEHIDSIILARSAGFRSKDLLVLIRERQLTEKKFQAISMGYDELKHQVGEIMRTLEAAVLASRTLTPTGPNGCKKYFNLRG